MDISTFSDCMRSLYLQLKAVYDLPITSAEKIVKKRSIIAVFKDSLENHYDAIFRTQDYRGLAKVNINNALVAIAMTYAQDMHLYYKLYDKNNRDLRKTIQALKRMKKGKEDLKRSLVSEN
jgi:predicted aminopeptidase